jgi:2-(1,2-epoxy-1,2-dihydrophenyl)acetyl-CoA isomerase
MVNAVVHPKAFRASLRSLALQYAQGPTQTYGFVKQLLQQGMQLSLSEMLDLEADYQQRAGESYDYAEVVQAFLEKRAANFQGR